MQKVVGTGATEGAPVIAVIGGGQLARMMQEAAIALGIELRCLVESADGSAAQAIPGSTVGQADDAEAVTRLANGEVTTVEHEHVPADILNAVNSRPSAAALRFAQNKIVMRSELDGPMPDWRVAATRADIDAAIEELGGVAVAKAATGGYDGKGVAVVRPGEDIPFWRPGTEILLEEKIDFDMELAALIARRPGGQIAAWPVVRTVQRDGICFEVTAPAPIGEDLAERAREIACSIAEQTGVVGVLAVEMFLAGDRLLINELAMRPHNSGHWTIDGAATSQFEQHLRAVADYPLGPTEAIYPASVMVNLLGSSLDDPREALGRVWEADPGVRVHMYGKEVRPGRKIGHVTVCGDDVEKLRARAHRAIDILEGKK